MVIQADGEKYACDACVRGHRVSSCTHKDRHLNHINKKGRPVSQCPHCRGARKNRASHVKCVCAELGIVRPNATALDHSSCQCMTGQRCTCALKRDAPASDALANAATVSISTHRRNLSKPGMVNRRSDSVVPKFQNGHHPPMHRSNYAAHDYSPYPIKRAATLHATPHSAQRSADSLPLATQPASHDIYSTSPSSLPMPSYMSGAGALSSNAAASASVPAGLHQLAGANKNGFAQVATSQPLGGNARWSINDFSTMSSYPNAGSEEFGSPADPLSGMSDSNFNWSDWDFNAVSAPGAEQHAGSVASAEHPGLSRSSSGTASDTGESSFNPADFKYPRLPAPGVPVSGAPSWPLLDRNWSSGPAGGRDKTPIPMTCPSSRASASVTPSNDFFGGYNSVESAKYPISRTMNGPMSFTSSTTSAFDGSMPALAMPNLASQFRDGWQSSPRQEQVKVEEQEDSNDVYRNRSWL